MVLRAGSVQAPAESDNFKRMELLKRNLLRIEESVDFTKSTMTLQFKVEQLQSCWAQIMKCNEDIILATGIDNQTEFAQLEATYEEMYIQLKEELFTRSNGEHLVEAPPACSKSPKLPALSIPTFTGRYEEWTPFWGLFQRLVHQNTTLSHVERMQYLKSSVRGEAARLMNHLTTTSGNYLTAIDLLTKRYQNPAVLVNKFIQKLFSLLSLMDSTREILFGISNLEVDTSSWDSLVIQLILPKLDGETRKLYQQSRGASTEIPKLNELLEFIEGRFRGLENSRESARENKPAHLQPSSSGIRSHLTTFSSSCTICNSNHKVYQCKPFLDMKIQERREKVQQARLCFNCLRTGHSCKNCSSKSRCSYCSMKHHSLLHEPTRITQLAARAEPEKPINSAIENGSLTELAASYNSNKEKIVLLATAMVNINIRGQSNPIRALIGQGSQSCVVTEYLAKTLKLPLINYNTQVNGISGHLTEVIAKCSLRVHSIHDNRIYCQIEAIVMPKITSVMPTKEFKLGQWSHIDGLQLADPWYAQPKEIQLLIRSDVLPEILREGVTTDCNQLVTEITSCVSICSNDELLKKFWELEEVPNADLTTNDENQCEQHYNSTHSRDENGRYVIRLPLRSHSSTLGDSRKMALKRFFLLEQRLAKNPILRHEYTKFIEEYITLGHMQEVSNESPTKKYYLPHHAVIKEDSTTTKLRVVFDASAKSTSGESLNNIMMIGPPLQRDLFLLLLQWRMFPVVFIPDIEKMYRQILVHEDERDLQRILWRKDCRTPIKEYRLNTVTYGTAAAPYLAIKTLLTLSEDEKINFPVGSDILAQRFYVDDCLGGSQTISEGKKAQKELIELLNKGGFKLRKWASNKPEMLKEIPKEDIETGLDMEIYNDQTIKVLGSKWCPLTDHFKFQINTASFSSKYTKRAVLSDAGRLFDPFGWISPLTIKAKMMIQKLWILGVGWDEEIPPTLQTEWNEFKTRLPAIQKIQIPRWTQQAQGSRIELHGFADASEKAYAAVIYTKVFNGDNVTISLTASKTKVAPVKQITLARLELCAAALLTKLIKYVQTNADVKYDKIVAWSDSKIVLHWLRQHPVKWTTFVANRVSYIQENFNGQFRFVPGSENPADIPSRGTFGDTLVSNSLWWNGPDWLSCNEETWPVDDDVLQLKRVSDARKVLISVFPQFNPDDNDGIISRFSSFSKLLRATAYCLRFIHNCQQKVANRKHGYLTSQELSKAEMTLVKCAQTYFVEDINRLKQGKRLLNTSKIMSLNPFVDAQGVLRVGGRLRHANLTVNQTHPMILHHANILTKLIIQQAHHSTLHEGLKLSLNYLRNKFWVIRGANAVKGCINKCMKCFRVNAKVQNELMGQLPAPRGRSTSDVHSLEVYHDIDALGQNQKALLKSNQATTKLMVSTIAAVSEQEKRISAKINNFSVKLNEGIKAINNMGAWYKIRDENKINIHILNAYLVATTKLLDAYLKRSHLYELVTHQRIEEVLANCTAKLGPNLEIQSDSLDDLEFSLTAGEIVITGYFIIADSEEYEVLKVSTIPSESRKTRFKKCN